MIARSQPARSQRPDPVVQAYRLMCALAVVLVPGFGVVYQLADPEALDPMWARVLVDLPLIALLASSYVSARIRHHFARLTQAALYYLVVWFILLSAINDFAANYAVGLLFVVVATGIAYSAGLRRIRPLLVFFAVAIAGSAVSIVAAPAPEVNPAIFIGCLSSSALLLVITVHWRLRTEGLLTESEERHRAVVEQLSEGVLMVDQTTFQILEANTAYCTLVGYTQEALRGLPLAHLISEATFQAWQEAASNPDAFRQEEVHLRKDGSPIEVETAITRITVAGQQVLCAAVHDISHRKQVERTLREAKETAERNLHLRATLLDNVTHEFYTPVNGILGLSELLSAELEGEQQEMMAHISDSARRLYDMLQGVVELAQLESGSVQAHRTKTDIGAIARQVIQAHHERAAEKGIALKLRMPPTGIFVFTDANWLKRALLHIVGNAVKFTEQGTVDLEVVALPDQVALHVQDTGIGMSEEFLSHLFEGFQQESSGLSRTHEGIGVGLVIAKHILHLTGGTIEARSRRGEGTTFSILLPRNAEGTSRERSSLTAAL